MQPSDLPSKLLTGAVEKPALGVSDSSRAALDPESRRVLEALEKTGGNRNRAAKILGLSRVTLWRRLRALGLEPSSAKNP